MEFIQSNVRLSLYLIKNPVENDSILKDSIKNFIIKKNLKDIDFYKYTSNTKYFINNKEDYTGGLSANEISFYKEFGIAELNIIKINKKECKIKSEIRYLNDKYGNYYNPDTLIYNCNSQRNNSK